MSEVQEQDYVNKIAVVIDGEVIQVLGLEYRLYLALISNPLIVDLKDNPDNISVEHRYNHETGEFIPKEVVE